MKRVTPEIKKQMEESGIPVIRLSLEDIAAAKTIVNPKEVEKINQRLRRDKLQ